MSKHLVIAVLVLGACATGTDPKIRTDIGAKLASAQTPIQACYQKSLFTNRKLRGMYVVQFAAAADTGQFHEITLRRAERDTQDRIGDVGFARTADLHLALFAFQERCARELHAAQARLCRIEHRIIELECEFAGLPGHQLVEFDRFPH